MRIFNFSIIFQYLDLANNGLFAGRNTNIEESDAALIELYPPTSTSLYSLTKDKRIALLQAMLLLLLSLEHYVSPSRILLLHVACSLHLPLHILTETEVKVAQGLLEAAKHMSGTTETEKRSEENKIARRWKVGLAGVAGAAVIGITGGLAAPLVAGAIGTVMGGLGLGATTAASLLGALAESGVIVGSLFGAYGGRMTGKMMDAYAKEVEDFAFLPLRGSKHHEPQPEDRRLRITIGVSGWLTQKEDIITPWRAMGRQSEVFALRWELEALTKLGSVCIPRALLSLLCLYSSILRVNAPSEDYILGKENISSSNLLGSIFQSFLAIANSDHSNSPWSLL